MFYLFIYFALIYIIKLIYYLSYLIYNYIIYITDNKYERSCVCRYSRSSYRYYFESLQVILIFYLYNISLLYIISYKQIFIYIKKQ